MLRLPGAPQFAAPRASTHDYNDSDYSSFSDADYKRSYDPRAYDGKCYRPYPQPPAVTTATKKPRPPPPVSPLSTQPTTTPSRQGINCDAPRSQAEFEQCHPPQQALPSQTQTQPQPPPGFSVPTSLRRIPARTIFAIAGKTGLGP